MPNVKESKSILDATPIDQAILFEGIHGIGKSEFVTDHYTSQGWRVVTLFLGQMSDAGDVIGLPDKTEDEHQNKITQFCPPSWWPQDNNEKLVLFLDELNRGKPEVMQCIMDMVLNRKLNGRALPKNCRIIAGMNPISDDGYYQVDELDPAFLDRFNRYKFAPELQEWLIWADGKKVHRTVTNFINKHSDHLDPITDAKVKSSDVSPSRRSWNRVSKIMLDNPSISDTLLGTMCLGIVGARSTAAFMKFVKEQGHGVGAGKIITEWSSEIQAQLQAMNVQDLTALNREVALWFSGHEKDMKASAKSAKEWAKNCQKYLETINPEVMAEFFDNLSTSHTNGQKWGEMLINANSNIADKFYEIMKGKPDTKKSKKSVE